MYDEYLKHLQKLRKEKPWGTNLYGFPLDKLEMRASKFPSSARALHFVKHNGLWWPTTNDKTSAVNDGRESLNREFLSKWEYAEKKEEEVKSESLEKEKGKKSYDIMECLP